VLKRCHCDAVYWEPSAATAVAMLLMLCSQSLRLRRGGAALGGWHRGQLYRCEVWHPLTAGWAVNRIAVRLPRLLSLHARLQPPLQPVLGSAGHLMLLVQALDRGSGAGWPPGRGAGLRARRYMRSAGDHSRHLPALQVRPPLSVCCSRLVRGVANPEPSEQSFTSRTLMLLPCNCCRQMLLAHT
jgi:hypothetical protein